MGKLLCFAAAPRTERRWPRTAFMRYWARARLPFARASRVARQTHVSRGTSLLGPLDHGLGYWRRPASRLVRRVGGSTESTPLAPSSDPEAAVPTPQATSSWHSTRDPTGTSGTSVTCPVCHRIPHPEDVAAPTDRYIMDMIPAEAEAAGAVAPVPEWTPSNGAAAAAGRTAGGLVIHQQCASCSGSHKKTALQLLQKSTKSASTTPQRPIWNYFGTDGVWDFWENGCRCGFNVYSTAHRQRMIGSGKSSQKVTACCDCAVTVL